MKQIKKIILSVLIIFLGMGGIKAQNKVMRKVHEGFNSMLEKDDVHNGFLQIKSADGTLNWKFIDGTFQDGTEVSEANPFHAASVGKMFTATLIMKLAEEGKLQLDDFISTHLPPEIVGGLHVYEGEDYSQKITIAQLLQHTSGLPDYIYGYAQRWESKYHDLSLTKPRQVLESRGIPGLQ
jgi:D-alanyl-D-alanine carboxypeptidase